MQKNEEITTFKEKHNHSLFDSDESILCNDYEDKEKDIKTGIQTCEHLLNSKPIVQCVNIKTNNKSWCVTKWELINLSNSRVIYTSNPCMRGESFELNLMNLSLAKGTQFYLNAAVEAGSDSLSSVILEYAPSVLSTGTPCTALFDLTGTTFDTSLNYRGLINNFSMNQVKQ